MKEHINGALEVDNLTYHPCLTGSPDVLSANLHPKASYRNKLSKLVEVATLCPCASIIVAVNIFLVVCRILEDKVVFPHMKEIVFSKVV